MSFHLSRPHFSLSPLIIPHAEEEGSRTPVASCHSTSCRSTTNSNDHVRLRGSPSPLVIPIPCRQSTLPKSPLKSMSLHCPTNSIDNDDWSIRHRYSALQIDSTASTDTDEYVISPNGTLITGGFKISASGVVSANDHTVGDPKSAKAHPRSHSHAHISTQALTGFSRLSKSSSFSRHSPFHASGHSSNAFRSISSSLTSSSFFNSPIPTTSSTCTSLPIPHSEDATLNQSWSFSHSQLPRLPSLSGSFRNGELSISVSDEHSPIFTVGLRPTDLVTMHSIGIGQHGQVMLAFHLPTLTCVALKTISVYDRSARHQLVKELYTYGKLISPYLVSFLGAYHDQGRIFMALEYMNCGSLLNYVQKYARPILPLLSTEVPAPNLQNQRNHLSPNPVGSSTLAEFGYNESRNDEAREFPELRSLTEPQIAEVARQSLLGLLYLHSNRRVHRDIKPENLLVNHQGYVKITDFGLTTELLQSQPYTASFLGTMAYLSPERVTAQSYKYPADIWSLGMTLVYCATGLPPTAENGIDYWKLANAVHQMTLSTPVDSSSCSPASAASPISYASTDLHSPASKIVKDSHPSYSPSFLPFTISPKYHSEELRSFLSACLVIDPDHRATAAELLNHPFILKYNSCPMVSSPHSRNCLSIIPDSSVLETLFGILLTRNAKCNVSPTNLQQISNMGIDWSMNVSFVDSNKSEKAIASAAALDDIDALAVPVEEENMCDCCETQHFTSSSTAIGTFELDDARLQHLAKQFAISPREVRQRLADFQKS